MSINSKAERSKALRYKKPALAELGYETICDKLYEIDDECAGVRWVMDSDVDTLTNALDGDEDEAFEFRMMFSELAAECEILRSALDEYEDYKVYPGHGGFTTLASEKKNNPYL